MPENIIQYIILLYTRLDAIEKRMFWDLARLYGRMGAINYLVNRPPNGALS